VSALPRATVAIVNWNGRHLLEECLPSVFALDYPSAELECVVVDNGSSDGSLAWL
jgi:glycosyltransferase involved in cell wall biosynthesis